MKSWFPIAAALMISGQSLAQEISLSNLINWPGSYGQMCSIPYAPKDLPYQLYGLYTFRSAAFSPAKLKAAQENRTALIAQIRDCLLKIDFSKKPGTVAKDPHPDQQTFGDSMGCDSSSLNPLLLRLILSLQATEALPELLIVEEKLVKAIATAEADADARAPWVDGWLLVSDERTTDSDTIHLSDIKKARPQSKLSREKSERLSQLFNARAAQRDLLITMCLLLREKKYEPFLNTSLEKAFVAGIKKQAEEEKFSKLKPGDPIPEELKGLIEFDPVTGLPYKSYPAITAPYTRESRDEVRAVAQRWIAEHP
jgi:hypothetical protein